MSQADLHALPVKWIFDPSFRDTPSYATDLRKTFERIREWRRRENAWRPRNNVPQAVVGIMPASQQITREEHGS